MSENIFVLYKGFQAKHLVREYTFTVRIAGEEPHPFTLTILNEAFDSRRVRFQDAPDICSRRLLQELTANSNRPPKDHFRVSDTDLATYRESHPTKPAPRYPSHKSASAA
jgi:hypothetical protein